jgi:hypothetical protein
MIHCGFMLFWQGEKVILLNQYLLWIRIRMIGMCFDPVPDPSKINQK